MSDETIWQRDEPRHLAGGDPTVIAVDDQQDKMDLLDDPFDDDLNERLAAAAPKRKANRVTYALGAIVLLVIGFVGGAQVQKSYGTSNTPAAANPFPSGLANQFGNRGGGQYPGGGGQQGQGNAGQGQGQQGGGNRGGITGTVKLVDGTTVYVEQPDGTVITVKTTGGTTVLAPGALKDIKAGSTVTVQGQNNDGTVDATSITKTK
jgi:hypothetical protein